MKLIPTFESFLNEAKEVPEPAEKDLVKKDNYKKGDYIYYRIWHPASTMLATSKTELSTSVYAGRIDKATKTSYGKPKYIVGYEEVPHDLVIGMKK